MENIELNIQITRLREDELDPTQQQVVSLAKAATAHSYSPYSHFRVGASVLLDNGEMVTGSNQENCAYPSGLCAERTAVFYANSRYPDSGIKMICVAACNEDGSFTRMPISPCGACRQVLTESEQRSGHKVQVLLYGTECCYLVSSTRDLLPLTFDESFL